MRRLPLLASYLSLHIGTIAHSALLDDFEDGDYTSNPTWGGQTGYYSVVADPTNPSNHALRGTGTEETHKSLNVAFSESIPWENFSFSIDLMSTGSASQRHGKIYVEFGDSSDTGSYAYHQRFDLGRIWDWLVDHATTPEGNADVFEAVNQDTPYEWHRPTIWHDATSNPDQINVQWEFLKSGTVLFQEISGHISPLADVDGLSWVQLSTEETNHYYYDNLIIQTIPEQSTVLLLVTASLLGCCRCGRR